MSMKKFLVTSRRADSGVRFSKSAYVCSSDSLDAVKKYIELCLARGFAFEDGEMEFVVEECD